MAMHMDDVARLAVIHAGRFVGRHDASQIAQDVRVATLIEDSRWWTEDGPIFYRHNFSHL